MIRSGDLDQVRFEGRPGDSVMQDVHFGLPKRVSPGHLMLSAMRAGRDVGPGARCFGGPASGRGEPPSVACARALADGEEGAHGRALGRLAARGTFGYGVTR